MSARELQVSRIDIPQRCERCRILAPLLTLDVKVPARQKTTTYPAMPDGWCPLISLCETCWSIVIEMLRASGIEDINS